MKGIFYCLFLGVFLLATFSPISIQAQIASIISEDDEGITGITSLMNAAINNDLQAVQFFSRKGSESTDKKNIGGATALHIATRNGNIEIASALIENGANVNISDNEGWTPLMRASLAGNPTLIRILLNAGAYATKMNSLGETAIIHATSSECVECLEQLFSGYDFVKNMNSEALRSQISQAITIVTNKNNEQIKSILQKYLDEMGRQKETLNIQSEETTNEGYINQDRGVVVKSLDNSNIQNSGKRNSYRKPNSQMKTYRFAITEDPMSVDKISSSRAVGVFKAVPKVADITPKITRYKLIKGAHVVDNSSVAKKQNFLDLEQNTIQTPAQSNIHQSNATNRKNQVITMGVVGESGKLKEVRQDKNQILPTNDKKEDVVVKIDITDESLVEQVGQNNLTPTNKTPDSVNVERKYIFLGDKKPFKPFGNKKSDLIDERVTTPKKQDKVVVKKIFIKKDSPRFIKNDFSKVGPAVDEYSNENTNVDVRSSEDEIQGEDGGRKEKYKFLGQKKSFTPLNNRK